jgi:hypothetical protein
VHRQKSSILIPTHPIAIPNSVSISLSTSSSLSSTFFELYDLYADTLLDTHLSGNIEHRKAGVLSLPFTFLRDGQVDETIMDQIDSPWFLNFIDDALDSLFWGFTLVQFYLDENGWVKYYMVPRKHVDPVLRQIRHRQEDITGTSFDEYPDLLMIRSKEPLGILAKTAHRWA